MPAWGASSGALSQAVSVPMDERRGGYYLRLTVRDRPGVIAEITAVLRDCGVSLKSMLQHGQAEPDPGSDGASDGASDVAFDGAVPIVLVTHETREASMQEAVGRIAALAVVLAQPTMIRIEPG